MRYLPVGAGPTRLPLRITATAAEAVAWVAAEIAALVRSTAAAGRPCVLILPTGNTPRAVYERLGRYHREEGLSFRHVISFNLDEYQGLGPDHPESYAFFMRREWTSRVDIDPANVHVPRGDLPDEAVAAHAAAYEAAVAAAGGVDLCLLGIGRNGHIGFNEPGASLQARTRLVALDRTTRADAAPAFGGIDRVPRRGVSMGVASIREARRILLLALGGAKATALAQAVEGPATPACPASLLQDHPQVDLVVDLPAAAGTTAILRPWVTGPVTWDLRTTTQAVCDLAVRTGTPILRLTEAHYEEHTLSDLVATVGEVEHLNRETFRHLTSVITGWPGGKPPAFRRPGDIPRPRDDLHPKRIVVLSPHPDDDVISMGGTLGRLADHGHQVHVLYGVAGHGGVLDEVADQHHDLIRQVVPGVSAIEPRRLKAAIRRAEAVAACHILGVPREQLTFLDLPFYDRPGRAPDAQDVAVMVDNLRRLQPHQIYAAGDLNDPHGTHRVVLRILRQALEVVAKDAWFAATECWLYRGAWADWAPADWGMCVPLTAADVRRKRRAILCHQSQKDRVAVPGEDDREFWQRAEERNRAAAELLDTLGLPSYQAVEQFAPFSALGEV